MAHLFNIIYSGGTISLEGGDNRLLGYTPTYASGQAEMTETARAEVAGTAVANIGAVVGQIQQALYEARDYKARRVGQRVYAVYQPDGYATAYRTEITDGAVLLDDNAMGPMWREKKVQLGVAFTRANYWEANTETALTLTNPNGANTSGLAVYNCNDGTGSPPAQRVNYADLAGTAITGDLPAPLILSVKNTWNSIPTVGRIFIGANSFSWYGGTALNHFYEYVSGGADQASADASGGYYYSFTSSSGTATPYSWDVMQLFNLTAAQVKQGQNRYFHALTKFQDKTNMQDVNYRINTVIGSSSAAGPVVRLANTNSIQDLGVVQVPPAWVDSSITYATGDIAVYVQRRASATEVIGPDWLMLMPADNYRIISQCNGASLDYNETVIDNPIDHPTPYVLNSSGAYKHPLIAYGSPLMVYPGRACRLLCAVEGLNGFDAKAGRSIEVTAKYRPRRSTL